MRFANALVWMCFWVAFYVCLVHNSDQMCAQENDSGLFAVLFVNMCSLFISLYKAWLENLNINSFNKGKAVGAPMVVRLSRLHSCIDPCMNSRLYKHCTPGEASTPYLQSVQHARSVNHREPGQRGREEADNTCSEPSLEPRAAQQPQATRDLRT